ncbi:MAG: glycosyltransferase family 1 protein [Isosphaeraceae bacterium]
MRISLITETYSPQVNGVSRTLGQLARVLRGAGDRVQVVHPDYGAAPGHPDDHLVPSIRMPFYRELYLPRPPFDGVYRAIEAFEPDLIHIATEATLGLAVHRRARWLGFPIVSSFHTNFDQYTRHYGVGFAKALIWRYLRWFHNATLQTYVPSNATIGDLRARGFERLVLWPRGVDANLFRPDRPGRGAIRQALGFAADDLVIGHVSRIAAEKNVGYLGEALRRVAQARPGVRLLIVGDGPARPSLEARLGESARFVGYRTGDDLADHYAACDLFAFASLTETFGNVILEAMASGLPVVAIRAGGPGDIVRPANTGYLVGLSDPPEAFGEALTSLIDDPAKRACMAANARAYALSQSWDAIMMGLRGCYQGCLEQASTFMA